MRDDSNPFSRKQSNPKPALGGAGRSLAIPFFVAVSARLFSV
jgi:hypothetical protein